MKMIQKKIKSLIYAGLGLILCVLLCGRIGMTAQAESDGYFTYKENESGITITGYVGDETELVIPGKIDGKKVTGIEEAAFYEYRSLKSITIPEGVTCIESYTFENCTSLTSITIPKGVTSIELSAFAGCSGLTSIMISESVTSISPYAFYGCNSLTSIIIDKGNKYYDGRDNCNAIIETKSNTLVKGCKKTVIPKSVTSIGARAFKDCSGLTSIIIPEGVTNIGYSAFWGCSGLTSITIPKSVTSIEKEAFFECSGLISITIPDSVTSIGDHAFGLCDKLVISCHKDSEIYKYAKANYLPVITISATEKPAKKGTTLTVSSKKINVKVTSSSKKNPTVTVTKITDKNTKKLTIPATVKVKGVTYKVTAVSGKAFKGNKKLTTVTIGSNVTKIGKEAFSGCKNLKKITVTAGKLKTISKNAFKGIDKKATITVKGTKKAKTALKKQLKKKSIGYVKTWKIK